MSDGGDRERVRRLMSRHLEHDLSEEEQAELEGALSRSQEACRELLLLSSLHHELFGLAAGRAAAPQVRSRRRIHPVPQRRTWISAVVAAGFLVAVAAPLLLLKTRPPENTSRLVERAERFSDRHLLPEPEGTGPEADRKQAEQDLELIGRKQRQLEELREQAERENRERQRREAEARLALLAAERQAAIENLERARTDERKVPEERPKPESAREPGAPETAVFPATLTKVEGAVRVFSRNRLGAARVGQGLEADDRLECGAGAGAEVAFGDGTRLDVGPQTTIAGWADALGKRISLRLGRLSAEVAKQPPGHPLLLSTPHGELRVLGTTLSLRVTSESTELEVQTGKVRLTRGKDGAGVDVTAGHLAEIASGVEFVPRPVRVYEFQDGAAPTARYAGTRSTYLSQDEASKNFAAADVLFADGDYPEGTRRDREILLQWDLSEIPPGVKVRAASILVHVADGSAHPYSIYPMRREWTETDATWLQSARNRSWQTGGGRGAADRATAAISFLTAAQPGTVTASVSADGLAIVQSWIDDPRANHGVMICNPDTSDAMGITSRRSVDPLRRPKLIVTVVSKPRR